MQDGIVNTGVYLRYCSEIIHLATWINENEDSWFTEYGKGMYNSLLVLREGKRTKERRKRVKQTWMEMLRNAKQVPIIQVESVVT
jgi:hypothetical protein